jgi:hypothetical protein
MMKSQLASVADLPMTAGKNNSDNKHVEGFTLHRSKNQRSGDGNQRHAGKGRGKNRFIGRLAELKMHTDNELETLLDQITKAKSLKDSDRVNRHILEWS